MLEKILEDIEAEFEKVFAKIKSALGDDGSHPAEESVAPLLTASLVHLQAAGGAATVQAAGPDTLGTTADTDLGAEAETRQDMEQVQHDTDAKPAADTDE